MTLPGRLETQRALVLDYRSHVARFGEIADYLERSQPPALTLWGRHDVFFSIEETLSWIKRFRVWRRTSWTGHIPARDSCRRMRRVDRCLRPPG